MDASPNKNNRSERIPGTSEAVDFLTLCGLLQERSVLLNAPAVALGVLKSALHFHVENFHEAVCAYGFGAGRCKVRSAMACLQDADYGLLNPICFERQTKSITQHHRRAED